MGVDGDWGDVAGERGWVASQYIGGGARITIVGEEEGEGGSGTELSEADGRKGGEREDSDRTG